MKTAPPLEPTTRPPQCGVYFNESFDYVFFCCCGREARPSRAHVYILMGGLSLYNDYLWYRARDNFALRITRLHQSREVLREMRTFIVHWSAA